MSLPILIIYTGGTVGMQPSANGYVPVASIADLLHDKLAQQSVSFEVVEFSTPIDSANLTPNDWLRLRACLLEHWHNYTGFVVLHGTDTMAYSASALSFLLQGMDKPVIFTGSQIPLLEARNDALPNLITALKLATYPITEVCLYFHHHLLRGNRSRKLHTTSFAAFESPNYPWLAESGVHIEFHPERLLQQGSGVQYTGALKFTQGEVCILAMQPHITGQLIEQIIASGVRGLILQSYGVGNPPAANQAFMHSLQQANQQGVVVLNTSQCVYGAVYQDTYASGAMLQQCGVVSGRDITPEAAFSKLSCLLAQHQDSDYIRQQMCTVLAGEMAQA